MSLVTSRVLPILFALLSLSASSIKSSEIFKTLQELNPGPSDGEARQFLLPKLADKYVKYVPPGPQSRARPDDGGTEDGSWDTYIYDPKLFLLTETEEAPPNEENYAVDYRDKREAMISSGGMANSFRGGNTWKNNGPSLSIVNPLDVLRQRLLLEIARRRQEQSQSQINENRKILTSLGKRSEGRPSLGGAGESRGRGDEFFTAEVYEPSESYSKWTPSLADFPRLEHRFYGHRNYNRHVN